MAAPLDLKTAPPVAGRYRLIRQLGRGGMATVYEAVNEPISKRVAIKMLHDDAGGDADIKKRFEAEARASAIVNSPHLVKVIDFGEEGRCPYIVMELLRGEPLSARMRGLKLEGRRMGIEELMAVVTQILDALTRCHDVGVVHRDLKPGNVWLCESSGPQPFVKLLDFGVARFLNHSLVADLSIPRTGSILGTPNYMAPEQTTRDEVDGRADLYAVGILLFKVLSGVFPHDSAGYAEHVVQLRTSEAPSLLDRAPGVDPSLASIVDRALERRPEDRFETARSMQRALVAWCARHAVHLDVAVPPSVAMPTSSWQRYQAANSTPRSPGSGPRTKGSASSCPPSGAAPASGPASTGPRSAMPVTQRSPAPPASRSSPRRRRANGIPVTLPRIRGLGTRTLVAIVAVVSGALLAWVIWAVGSP